MSQLQNVLSQFRKELAAKEATVSEYIFRQYTQSALTLRRSLNAVLQEIIDLQAEKQPISQTLLYRRTRFEMLLQQVDEEIGRFANSVDPAVREAKETAVSLALQASEQLVSAALDPLPKKSPVPLPFTKFSPRATQELLGRLADPAPTTELFRTLAPKAVEGVREKMVANIIAGQNPLVIRKAVSEELGVSVNRAKTILRTEQISAYRQGNIEAYRANENVVARWRWTAALNSRTCAMCLAMDGREFPVTEDFGSHPNCRCAPVPVTKSWEELGFSDIPDRRPKLPKGEEWFEKQDRKTKLTILGPTKLQKLEAGELKLEDLIAYRVDPTWGPNRWERSLIAIKEGRDIPPPSAMGLPAETTKLTKPIQPKKEKKEKQEARGEDVVKQILKQENERLTKLTALQEKIEEGITYGSTLKGDAFDEYYYGPFKAMREERRKLEEGARADALKLIKDRKPQTEISYTYSDQVTKKRRKEYDEGFKELRSLIRTNVFKGKNIPVKNTLEAGPNIYAQRSFYRDGELFMAPSSGAKTAIHEMVHAWEHLDEEIHKKAVAFLDKRTAGEEVKKLTDLKPNAGFDESEICKPDKFFSPYCGRVYLRRIDELLLEGPHAKVILDEMKDSVKFHVREGSTEILSMGIERMYDDPVSFAKEDPEYFAFVYDTMKGL